MLQENNPDTDVPGILYQVFGMDNMSVSKLVTTELSSLGCKSARTLGVLD